MKEKLIIYGASGHGIVAADIALLNGYKKILFCDDDPNKDHLGDYPVIHSLDQEEGYDLFIAIGDNATRQMISERYTDIVTLIHPRAVIARSAVIEKGCIVMAGAVVNPLAHIGKGAIINTCSSIDHNDDIGRFAHISVGAHLAGGVNIGERVFVGAGAVVINNIDICDDSFIGAGAAVVSDISEKGTYIGVPARKL